jgi:ATP-dependent Clp protease ATP-binding subunit ClpX
MSIAPNEPAQEPQEQPATWEESFRAVPSPKYLVEHLDRHVVGQAAAKKRLAVAVSNHYKRLLDHQRRLGRLAGPNLPLNSRDLAAVTIEKSNVLLIGPSGSGKTLLVNCLADLLGVPVALGDATTLTETGYAGEDVESLLVRLYQAAEGDVEAAQQGIVFIDEIDKLRAGQSQGTRDLRLGAQQALLRMIEGTTCSFLPNGSG